MLIAGAIVCGALALVAGGLGFTGVAKGIAGAAKAMFFGFLAIAGTLAALGMLASKKLGAG